MTKRTETGSRSAVPHRWARDWGCVWNSEQGGHQVLRAYRLFHGSLGEGWKKCRQWRPDLSSLQKSRFYKGCSWVVSGQLVLRNPLWLVRDQHHNRQLFWEIFHSPGSVDRSYGPGGKVASQAGAELGNVEESPCGKAWRSHGGEKLRMNTKW